MGGYRAVSLVSVFVALCAPSPLLQSFGRSVEECLGRLGRGFSDRVKRKASSIYICTCLSIDMPVRTRAFHARRSSDVKGESPQLKRWDREGLALFFSILGVAGEWGGAFPTSGKRTQTA